MFSSQGSYFTLGRPLNLLEDIEEHPDLILQLLQEVINYSLTPEQYAIARFSALELAYTQEITISDLIELWLDTPALSVFASILRYYLLP